VEPTCIQRKIYQLPIWTCIQRKIYRLPLWFNQFNARKDWERRCLLSMPRAGFCGTHRHLHLRNRTITLANLHHILHTPVDVNTLTQSSCSWNTHYTCIHALTNSWSLLVLVQASYCLLSIDATTKKKGMQFNTRSALNGTIICSHNPSFEDGPLERKK